MNKLSQKLRAMFGTEDESKKPKEKTYKSEDINIVQDTKDGNIYVCTLEFLEEEKKGVTILGANNIENGARIVEYRLIRLPVGRPQFGGYVDGRDRNARTLYSFADIWYKTHGERLSLDRVFTESELLSMVEEIRDKLKEAKYMYLYSIKYKDSFPKKHFTGTRYFGCYTEEKEGRKIFETIDDNNLSIQVVGDAQDASLMITIDNKEINAKTRMRYCDLKSAQDFPFEIARIETIGVSRVFNKAKYTPDACRQIIRNYEREKEQGRG